MTIKFPTRPRCPVPTKPTPIPRCPPMLTPTKPKPNNDWDRNNGVRSQVIDRFEIGGPRRP